MDNFSIGRVAAIGAILFAAAIYIFSIPQDFSEAEDALWYAHDVERLPTADLFHPFHLLYLPMMKVIYGWGLVERAYPLLLFADKVAGLIALVLFFILQRRRFGLNIPLAFTGTGLLGVSYGFWRYSNTGEVYVIAAMLSIALALAASSEQMNARRSILAGVLAAAALLMHPINLTLACIAVPARFIIAGKRRELLLYTATGFLLVAGSYFAAFGTTLFAVGGESVASLNASSLLLAIPKNIIGFGAMIVCGNFVFTNSTLASLITSLFPGRMLHEEIFNGARAGLVSRVVPFATALSLAAVALAMIRFAARETVGQRLRMLKNPNAAMMALWLCSYIAIMIVWEPGEGWIMCLVPFWAFLTPAVLAPVHRVRPRIVYTFAVLLFLHNYTGGILLQQDKANDYIQQKSVWLLEHASERDLILCLDKGVYEQYLRYFSKAQIVNIFMLEKPGLDSLSEKMNDRTRNIYATSDVFITPEWYKQYDRERSAAAMEFAARMSKEFDLVFRNEMGGVYKRTVSSSGKANQK